LEWIPGRKSNYPRKRFFILCALFLVGCAGSPGDQMIQACSSNGQADVLQTTRLMKEHPDVVKYANSHGTTPLHAAARAWNFIVVANLLNAGADPNARDKDGNTPLHLALSAIVAQNQGASQNLPGQPLTEADKQKRDAVQGAVAIVQEQNREDIVRYLLSKGADATIKNNEGKTPPEFSEQSQKVYERVLNMMKPMQR
jgi:cytohesin